MSHLSPRKVISLAVLLPFIIVQFALSSPPVSAQGETPPLATSTPTPMLDTPTSAAEIPLSSSETQSATEALTPLASTWSTPVNISVMSSDSSLPSIAVGASGSVHVVWVETASGSPGEIFYTYKSVTGWSTPINVSNSSTLNSNYPQVAVDSSGSAHIVWAEQGDEEILYSKCTGSTCTTPVSLSGPGDWYCNSYRLTGDWSSGIPILSINQYDRLMVEWVANEPADITMPYSTWLNSGTPPTVPSGCIQAGPDIGNRRVGRSRMMAGVNGSFALAFDELRNDNTQGIYYSRYSNSNGQWLSPAFLEAGNWPDLFLDRMTDDLHLTWCDSNSRLRYWNSADYLPVATIPGALCTWHSPIARDTNGLMHVLWQESGQIYESRKLPDGWSEKANISSSSAGAYTPDMVVEANGGLHLVWQELRNGNWEIFYLADSVYDCSGITLSPIAQAVRDIVGSQRYCGNHYDDGLIEENKKGLIILPPGEQAFERFGNLAQEAHYEIDFTNMIWDPDGKEWNPDGTRVGDSPGRIFLRGLQQLAVNIQNDPGSYPPEGVRVRILLGLKKGPYEEYSYGFPHWEDQRLLVLDDLEELGLLNNPKLNIEVAVYRDGLALANHSHAKMMIVDGQEVIAAGYNMQYSYLNGSSRRDMGLQVSGPITGDSLHAFDTLWQGAKQCDQHDGNTCTHEALIMGPIYHHPAILNPTTIGNDVVFSLYRDGDRTAGGTGDKTADKAIVAAIKAASTNVNIMQDRFMMDPLAIYPPYETDGDHDYARAILNTLEKEGSQVTVKLLVTKQSYHSIGESMNTQINATGICTVKEILRRRDPSELQYFETRSSKFHAHTKALSIDNSFVVVGSQNFDVSAFGDDLDPDFVNYDLAEYSLAIDSTPIDSTQAPNTAADDFDSHFMVEWDPTNSDPIVCHDDSVTLQSEIDQAVAGSIIFIPEGIYSDTVTVDKPLVLVGSDSSQTIIQATSNEPALRVTSSDVTIMNMKVSGGAGYGIELIETSPGSPRNIQINRVVFENNAQGGILIQGLAGGSPTKYTIENNTFIGGADGITINMPETQADTSIIRNNIFSGQSTAPIHILSSDDSRVEYSYNLFDDCGAGSCATNWHLGNMSPVSTEHDDLFDLDPLFVDAATGVYQLSAGSPAIDAGDPSLLHESFYDGDNDGTAQIDIGAFESVDGIAPTVSSVQIANVQQGAVNYTVTFSEPVTGVDITDFTLTTTNAPDAAISSVSGSEGTYTVSVTIGMGDGTIRLDVLDDDTILDLASNPLAAGFTSGETYTIPSCNLVTHSPEIRSGNTMSMTITNPTTMALQLADIFVRWDHDKGHEVGLDKTLILQQVSLNSTTLWTGSQAGPTYTFLTNATLPAGTSTITFTFHQTYDRSDGSENIRLNLATDGCQAYPIDSDNLLTQTPGAIIDTFIGGVKQGSDFVADNSSQQKSYVGVNTGPVKIVNTNTMPIIASERVIYKVNNVETSYAEMMGLPDSQLDMTYWLPWYNSKTLDTQLLFANASSSTATVNVYIGGAEVAGSPFSLAAGASVRKTFANIDKGPVKIESNVPIVAAERVIYENRLRV